MATTVTPMRRGDTWIQMFHQIIDAALKDVPMTANEKEIRAILFPLYPSGERAMHPYKQWCKAVRVALRERGLISERQPQDMTIRLVFTACTMPIHPEGLGPSHWIQNFLCVKVLCRWCQNLSEDIAGCLMCRKEIDVASGINGHPEFNGLCHAMRIGNTTAQALLVDWMLEHSHDDLAEQVRAWE